MEDHRVPAEAPPSDAAPPAGTGDDRAPWPGRPVEPSEAPPSYRPEPGAGYEPPPPPSGTGPLWPAPPDLSGMGGRSPWGPPAQAPPAPMPPPVVEAAEAPARPAAVGRASAPTVTPPTTGVPHPRGAASTYRAGEFSREERLAPDPIEEPPATEPSRPPMPVPGELPRRREGAALAAEAPGFLAAEPPGFLAADRSAEPVLDLPIRRPRTAAESPWAAFAQPWLDSPAKPAGQQDPLDGGSGPLPDRAGFAPPAAAAAPAPPVPPVPSAEPAPPVRPASARARVGVPGESTSAADVMAIVRRPVAPRVYRSGGATGPEPVPPPSPEPPSPEPVSPPPAPAPQPSEPPGPPPPSPLPTPFPDPTPVPQPPPAPVPPEPPVPEPTPGPVPPAPPIPPVPPFPQPPSPVPPGPPPVPPFPPPPATGSAESIEVPAGALPTWPPSTTPGPSHNRVPATPPTPAGLAPPSPTPPLPTPPLPTPQSLNPPPLAPPSLIQPLLSAPPPLSPPVPTPLTAPTLMPGGTEPSSAPPGQPEYLERLNWRGPSAPERSLSASDRYGDWARSGRPQGTVYGQPGPLPVPMATENSGSLTGHILAQGHPVVPLPSTGRSKFMVTVVVLVSLLVLGAIVAGIAMVSGALTR